MAARSRTMNSADSECAFPDRVIPPISPPNSFVVFVDIVSLLTCGYAGDTDKPRSEFLLGGTDSAGSPHPRGL
jgi:hypothetical protein